MNRLRMVVEENIRNAIEDNYSDGEMFTTANISEITDIKSWHCSYALRTMVRRGELEVAEQVPLDDGFGPTCGYTNVYRLPVNKSTLANEIAAAMLADKVADAFGFKHKSLSDYSDQEIINELKRRMSA